MKSDLFKRRQFSRKKSVIHLLNSLNCINECLKDVLAYFTCGKINKVQTLPAAWCWGWNSRAAFALNAPQRNLILQIPHWSPTLIHHTGSHGIFGADKGCQNQQSHSAAVTWCHMLWAIVPDSSAELGAPVKSLFSTVWCRVCTHNY